MMFFDKNEGLHYADDTESTSVREKLLPLNNGGRLMAFVNA